MSYQVYKVIHLVGVFMVLLSLGGIGLHMINGGTRIYQARRWTALIHGIGLLLALVGGFGLMARLGVHSFPPWVATKLVIWILLGLTPALFYRKARQARALFYATLVLAGLAAFMAIYKPGASIAAGSGAPEEASATAAPAPATEDEDPAMQAPADTNAPTMEATPAH